MDIHIQHARGWSLLRLAVSRDTPISGNATGARTDGIEAAVRDRFAMFFAQYEGSIIGYLWRMVGDEGSAADLAQETFLRAWQHFATIEGYTKPSAWLFKVASNLALQHLRRRQAPVGAAVALDEETGPASSDHGRRIAEQDLVRRTLLAISPRLRAVLILREVYGLMGTEIAAALGMTPAAVKMALWRAAKQFREIYRREEADR